MDDDRDQGGDDRELVVAVEHPVRTMDTDRVERLARAVLAAEGCRWTYVGIVFDAHDAVHALNRDYLQHDYETDVLSFLIEESAEGIEGEVYVDLDTAAENAERYGTTFDDEAARYVVHGLLHLTGYDDGSDDERAVMTTLENRYLETCWTHA